MLMEVHDNAHVINMTDYHCDRWLYWLFMINMMQDGDRTWEIAPELHEYQFLAWSKFDYWREQPLIGGRR